MKHPVYYSEFMKEKLHDKKVGKARKICMYTLVAVLSMQGAQMYSMASFQTIFQRHTNIKANPFEAKKYTNVKIEEPNGTEYTVDESGNVYKKDGTVADQKVAYFTNPISNVTYEYVRARVVAVVKTADGNDVEGIKVDYHIEPEKADDWENKGNYYYYKKPLKPGGTTSNFLESVTITSPTSADLKSKGQYIELSVIVDTVERDEGDDKTKKAKEAWGESVGSFLLPNEEGGI